MLEKNWVFVIGGTAVMAIAVVLFAGCIDEGAPPEETKVTLTAYFSAPKERWDALVVAAEEKFEEENPDIDIEIDSMVYPYADMHKKLLIMASTNATADIVSVDQIWLGEFVEAGYIKDITGEATTWGIEDTLYAPYLEGCRYNNSYHAVWAWTDARLLWYRRDILEKADVEPEDLETWDGFLNAVPQINEAAEAAGMGGVAFPGAAWLVDWWYPFLFENGGEILTNVDDGYEAGFNNEAGREAAEFLLAMKQAGVEFPTTWLWGEEFAAGSHAVWFGGTWVVGKFTEEEKATITDKVGVMMFPAPEGKEPRTLSGGWLLAVPSSSEKPDIAWEFTQCMLDPEVLTPVLAEYAYLPTQKQIVENPAYASKIEERIPFWSEFEDALTKGAARPSMPEYAKVSEILYEELAKIIYEETTPEEGMNTAAEKVNALWHD